MKNSITPTAAFIFLLMTSQLLMAGDGRKVTNFLKENPSSEQLVEALKTPEQLNFRGIKVTPVQTKILLNINFEFGSDNLTPESMQTLSELGKALKNAELINRNFVIAGHTDSKGTKEYNQKLSLLRALAVYNYIIKKYKIDSNQLKPVGMGELKPINVSNPESAENRRVEIINLGHTYQ